MTRPADLADHDRENLDALIASCPQLTALVEHVRDFATLLTERRGTQLHRG